MEESIQSFWDRSGLSWLERHFPSGPFVSVGGWIARHYRRVREKIRHSLYSSRLSLTKTSTIESSLENGHGFGSAMRLAEERVYRSASPEPMSPVPARSFSNSTIRSPISTGTHSMNPTTPTINELGSYARGSIDSYNNTPSTPVRWRPASDFPLPQRPPLAHANTYPESRPISPNGSLTEEESAARRNFRALATKVIVSNRTAQASKANMANIAASVHASSGGTPPDSASPTATVKDAFTAMPAGVSKSRASTTGPLHPFGVPRKNPSEAVVAHQKKIPRLASIVPSLRSLSTRETLNEHTALVRHLQFSPDGQFCQSINSSVDRKMSRN